MTITIDALIVLILVGLIAGWLAGVLTTGSGFGLIGNIIVGILGAFLGYYVLRWAGIGIAANPLIVMIVQATIGAVALLLIIRLLR